jgi:uncharacterized DUF497 family protein
MGIRLEWDDHKRLANLSKYGLDFIEAHDFDWAGATTDPVIGGPFQALGLLHGSFVSIVFAKLGTEALSIISMRPASRKERRLL